VRKPWMNAASSGAIVSALATLSCCLPPAVIAAGGFAALAVVSSVLRPWLLGVSVLCLAAGVFAAVRGARCGTRPSKVNLALLILAGVLVILAALFPQVLAGFVADFFYRADS
jgi:hypothetical protein